MLGYHYGQSATVETYHLDIFGRFKGHQLPATRVVLEPFLVDGYAIFTSKILKWMWKLEWK